MYLRLYSYYDCSLFIVVGVVVVVVVEVEVVVALSSDSEDIGTYPLEFFVPVFECVCF